MAKCPRNICGNEIEELVFYSDSEEQYTSDEWENESTNRVKYIFITNNLYTL
jgi:hypothetical protein